MARRRLVGAFRETGRGLIVGSGATALVQGLLATVAYLVLAVRNPFMLGLLTGVASVVPAVGTALVWAPVALALALAGHPLRAAILVGIGLGAIGTVDNLLRPWLSRLGHLQLPTSAVFLSMLGGIDLLGARGIILGPLLVRMAIEALVLGRVLSTRSGAGLASRDDDRSSPGGTGP